MRYFLRLARGALATVLCLASTGDALAQCKSQSLGGTTAWARVDRLFKSWLSDPAHSNLSDWEWSRTIDLGGGKPAKAFYGVTHMGNGTIALKNLSLRVYRDHQGDGFTYRPSAFQIFLRPGPSGCRLSISGAVDLLGADDEKVVGHGPVTLVYDYDNHTGRFHRISSHAPIPLDNIDMSK